MLSVFDKWIRAARTCRGGKWQRYLQFERRALKSLAKKSTFELMTLDLREMRDRFKSGFAKFCVTGRTDPDAYLAMRQLHMATKGGSDAAFAAAAATVFPVIATSTDLKSPVFGDISAKTLTDIMAQICRDGIYVFPIAVRSPVVAEIKSALVGLPVISDDGNNAGMYPDLDDSPRVFFAEQDLLKCGPIRSLILDPLLVEIARQSLQLEPIFESVSVYHTRPHDGNSATLSSTAQMYHIDRDRLTFLNFFLYLDDVTADHGPHWFVKGSHVTKPDDYWQDRRFSDAEIEGAYAFDDILCITGKGGTLFAANTSAFHKGSPPLRNSRTVLQIRYASSLFGAETHLHGYDPFEERLKQASMTMPTVSRMLVRFGMETPAS